ncbi:uroporphyrinogen-III synthase [Marinovum sp. 2_MG-2023]|uniref:uroporphyrinogen-III synthase n=1 Tax=unclassified Marinovum TaxID=2647166 RepID=UPI0026E13A19|nr:MULTISPECIES: uroporphyrinogen-III synthase [unclassified Marinovum]MDO6730629.1 uroporphyrinogen-III synthase [Marinovum sp. 2_MG-2023]MDO6778780.1 uroporphyrinogen-III synthase [Marinovum sp. 1_MG-2023]
MTEAKPALLLTRPHADAARFLSVLQGMMTPGRVVIAPVLDIAPIGGQAPIPDATAVIFTSANAVAAYAGSSDRLAYCLGARTTKAAENRGFAAKMVGVDADSLVKELLRLGPVGPVLHLRGRHTRGDVAARLRDGGLNAQDAVVYEQRRRDLTAEARQLLNGDQSVILPLFSPRSADIVAAQGPFAAPICVVAISEAVAEHAAAMRPRRMAVAEQPDLISVCAAVAALFHNPSPLEGA